MRGAESFRSRAPVRASTEQADKHERQGRRAGITPGAFAAIVLALPAASGCGEILDIPEHPKLVGPWRCLQEPASVAPPEDMTATVRVQACNFVSSNCGEPVVGLTASLCNKKDLSCTQPVRANVHDVNGELTFDVPTKGTVGSGFDGYAEIVSSTALCTSEMFGEAGALLCSLAAGCDPLSGGPNCYVPTFTPALVFFNPPVTADLAKPVTVQLVPSAAVPMIIQALNRDFDTTTGNVFVTAIDCDGKPAAGVRLEMKQHQDRVTVLYIDDGVISDTATETDASGLGGFLGVPSGFVVVSGTIADDSAPSKSVVIGEVGLHVAPSKISYGTLAVGS